MGDNPADDASRGVPAGELASPRWLRGPGFLALRPGQWPTLQKLPPLNADDPEIKRPLVASFASLETSKEHAIEKLVASYSNWTRLLRVMACFTLAADVCRKKTPPTKELQVGHMQQAEEALMIHVQAQYYGDELRALSRGDRLPSSSPLIRLRPTLRRGLLVVTG